MKNPYLKQTAPAMTAAEESVARRHPSTTTMRMVPAPTDLAGVAQFILSSSCRSIVVLAGAGVSVASGIPDFRSPGGMYDSLRPELLTATPSQRRLMEHDPTYVVSWEIFRENSFPYLEVRRPFILGTRAQRWKATLAHRFFELLHAKTGKLTRLYTQNIDGLDMQCTGLPASKVVPVHGSIAKANCEGCGAIADYDDFCDQVEARIKDIYQERNEEEKEEGAAPESSSSSVTPPAASSPIYCRHCSKPLVKPSTVLFGRSLPDDFFRCAEQDLPDCDLLLVAGTSLVVSPANSLVQRVSNDCLRIIVNREPVGRELGLHFGGGGGGCFSGDGRDVWLRGTCDAVFLALARELGWIDDLKAKLDLLPHSSRQLLLECDGDDQN